MPTPVPMDSIELFALQRGALVASTPNEVVFEILAPGLPLLVSYYLTDPGPEQGVTASTVVFYESVVGALGFTPVPQVHQRGVPCIVWRMTNSEPLFRSPWFRSLTMTHRHPSAAPSRERVLQAKLDG